MYHFLLCLINVCLFPFHFEFFPHFWYPFLSRVLSPVYSPCSPLNFTFTDLLWCFALWKQFHFQLGNNFHFLYKHVLLRSGLHTLIVLPILFLLFPCCIVVETLQCFLFYLLIFEAFFLSLDCAPSYLESSL